MSNFDEQVRFASGAICNAADLAGSAIRDAAHETMRPSILLRPLLTIDGDQWCALYGDNIQDGVAGFGNSPAEAFYAFDHAFRTQLPKPGES